MTIQKEEAMNALKRKDYTVRVFHEGATPSRQQLRSSLAHHLKAKQELLVVRQISPVFGSSASVVRVSVYDDEAAMQQFESAHIVKRHAPKEAKA